jgi:glycogen debranching enzyme
MKKTAFISIALLCSLLLFLFPQAHGQSSEKNYSKSIMAGISNMGQNKNQPYVTAGDRTYIIGTQDGNFPDMGGHVKGEMGGLWLHPIKLMDGFWIKLKDINTENESWLSEAVEFVNYPYGNKIKYSPVLNGLETERFQFCPDGQQGMIIQYTIKNTGNQKRTLKLGFFAKTDISPVWFSKEIGIIDHIDKVVWEPGNGFFIGSDDSAQAWTVIWGATIPSSGQLIGTDEIPQKTIGNGIAATSDYCLSIDKNSSITVTFIIAGSAKDKTEAINAYKGLAKNHAKLLEEKKKHYASIIERARIKIPDQSLQEVYNWIKINTAWLIRDVPGIGRGLGAGFMEYPWWFGCDNTYSLQAVMATGDFDLAKQTLRLLKNESMKKNGNGRIAHEISTNGAVANPGNTQETAQFIMCVEKLFEWTGDMVFIKEMYPIMKMGINWLLKDMDQNKNFFPEGYGIMEVYGLNAELIDVAVYTQQALKATARIAAILNDLQVQNEYLQLSATLAERINEDFWDETEGSYCDFYGNTEQAVRATEGAIRQLGFRKVDSTLNEKDKQLLTYYEQLKNKFFAMPATNRGWITNKNWVINTPMETGIAPAQKAIKLLDKIRKEHLGAYGPYLSAVEKRHMMTIATGVQAVAEYMYGRTDESMWYVNKIVQTFNRVLPGSISEMMPDYGCFTQAWTSYGIVLPLVRHVFGIQPDASNKSIVFEPHLPSGWEDISIENLFVGNNTISFTRTKTSRGIEYILTSKEQDWNIILKLKDSDGAKYYLNGMQISLDSSGIKMNGKNNKLLIKRS